MSMSIKSTGSISDTAKVLFTKGKDLEDVYEGGLQVIGAGFGRTGTSSMQLALEKLYGAPCYHMREIIGKQHAQFFIDLEDKKLSVEQIREHFKCYACTQDVPTCFYWEELLKAYPNAKVVLTVRDFDGWWTSCNNTIFCTAPGNPKIWWGNWIVQHVMPPWIKWANMMWKSFYWKHMKGDFSRENGKRMFEEWNASVIAKCPKDRLLVFDVKEGWGPLCKFLGKPVPDEPFPRVNDTSQMLKLYRIKNGIGYAILTVGVAVVAIGVKAIHTFM